MDGGNTGRRAEMKVIVCIFPPLVMHDAGKFSEMNLLVSSFEVRA